MFALASVAWLSLGAPSMADARERAAPRSALADPEAKDRAGRVLTGACRSTVLDELEAGQRSDHGCEAERRRGGRAATRLGDVFGYVASRDVDLRGVRLVVGRAVLCRRWPLRKPDNSVLRLPDIEAARCRPWRMRAPIEISVVGRDGTRVDAVMLLTPDEDGRVELSYGALDLRLRAQALGTLHDYAQVEIGRTAWAGTVDLERLRQFRASWHLRWIREGRGAPGLFAVRHAEHSGADVAQQLHDQAAQRRRGNVELASPAVLTSPEAESAPVEQSE